MSELLVRQHLGTGDLLIGNGLVRFHAKNHSQTVVLVKSRNVHTAAFMFRDDPKIEVFAVENDEEADSCAAEAKRSGFAVLKLGFYSDKPFDKARWDQSFFEQAEVPFQERWNGFRVSQQPSREIEVPKKPFCLIHEDVKRGYRIREELLPKNLLHFRVDPSMTANLFDYWSLIQKATELHLMESCVAILADSLPDVSAKRRCIHAYTRESIPPKYQGQWEILK